MQFGCFDHTTLLRFFEIYISYLFGKEPTETSNRPIRTSYLGHVTGYQPISDQYSLIRSVPDCKGNLYTTIHQEPTGTSKQPIRTRYLGHVTGYQPIRDQYFLFRSVPAIQSPV
eukprot:sb/3476913/